MNWSEEKKRYFKENVSLILSGGGSLGLFHIGVIKKLHDYDLVPYKIHGTSVGSIIAAVVCCYNYEERSNFLHKIEDHSIDFFDSTWWSSWIHFYRNRSIHSGNKLIQRMKELIGDMTFLEAYKKTGYQLNITLSDRSSNKGHLVNYKNAPNTVIWSAVSCSTAFPLFFPEKRLYEKRDGQLIELPDSYSDGAIFLEIPDIPSKLKIISITNPFLMILSKWYAYTQSKESIHKIMRFLKNILVHRHWIFRMLYTMMRSSWDFKHTVYVPFNTLLFLPFMMFHPPFFLWKRWIQYGYQRIDELSLKSMFTSISKPSLDS